MFNIFIVLSIFYFIAEGKTGKSDAISEKPPGIQHRLRLLDARNAEVGEYPYVVIGFGANNWQHREFTAAMIAKEWAITCSHCIESVPNPHIWYAKFASTFSKESPTTKVLNIYMHPSYRAYHEIAVEDVLDNDIALLRVHEIEMPKFGRLLPVEYWTLLGAPVTFVISEMMNKTGEVDGSRPLKVGEGTVTTCDQEFRGFNRHLICVAPKCANRLQIPYFRDAGAPVFYDDKIIGVLSYVVYNKYMVKTAYAPVSSYIDWVTHILEAH